MAVNGVADIEGGGFRGNNQRRHVDCASGDCRKSKLKDEVLDN